VTMSLIDRTPMSLLAEARTAINYMINDVIDETMTSTSRDESIVATITPFDEGLESDRWRWTMPKLQFWSGGWMLSLVAAQMMSPIVASDDSKCK